MQSLRELLGARELLRTFVSRDLQVRYKGSALGIVWSLLNPALMMGVYTAVFSSIMRNHITDFPVFFMSGFLPWTFFATALQTGSFALLANASLLQKVYFPREVLPVSVTLANLVNLGLAFAVFVPLGLYLRGFTVSGLLGVLPTTIFLLMFTTGMVMLFSALMVFFRDIEFLLGVILQAWFFLTPIVYEFSSVPSRLARFTRFNPMLPFVNAYRDSLYDGRFPPVFRLVECALIGSVTLVACYLAFNRMKRHVVEEL
ncbi:MAG: lipopolysaccharide transport system permease protein [Gaiellales bacterium]|nr:lipopolysaccharide transport system permease protein [Gaiellales bacterium]